MYQRTCGDHDQVLNLHCSSPAWSRAQLQIEDWIVKKQQHTDKVIFLLNLLNKLEDNLKGLNECMAYKKNRT